MNRPIARRLAKVAGGLAALVACGLAAPATAGQVTITPPPATPLLGKVIVTSGTSVFSIGTDGTVTRTSGSALRLTSGSITPTTINMSCGLLNLENLCALRSVRITVQALPSSGPARITQLRMSGLTGATMSSAAPAPGSTITFTTYPMGLLTAVSFKLGMDVEVSAGVTGPQTFDYRVTAEFI